MKVLYDYQTFNEQNFGGVSRYISFLSNHIKKLGVKSQISVVVSNNDYLKEDQIGLQFFRNRWFPKKLFVMSLINKFYTLFLLKTKRFDVFHATYFYDYYFGKVSAPVVVTVYDMIHEKLYDQYKELRDDVFIERKKKSLLNADMIIAISENTRKDVLDLYPAIKPEKIKTIHLCLMTNEGENTINDLMENHKRPYYLFVGSRIMYKDFSLLIDAVAYMGNAEFDIICAGGTPFSNEEIKYMEQKKVTEYFIYRNIVNDFTLNQLYKQAIGYISTSAYEGFGLPILEAFNNQCAVILRDNPCYKEIGDYAAEYFSNTDIHQFVVLLKKIHDNVEYRNSLKERGAQRLKFFDKEKMIEKTMECYELLGKHNY